MHYTISHTGATSKCTRIRFVAIVKSHNAFDDVSNPTLKTAALQKTKQKKNTFFFMLTSFYFKMVKLL